MKSEKSEQSPDWVQTKTVTTSRTHLVSNSFFTARRQIRDIEKGIHSGDCDDFVILGGSLLGSLGYPVGAFIVDSNNDGIIQSRNVSHKDLFSN